jgi:hypothetical protein
MDPMSRLALAASLTFCLAACGPPSAKAPAPSAPPPKPTTSAAPPAPASAPLPSPGTCAVAEALPALAVPRLDLHASAPSRDNLRAWIDTLADPALHGRAAGSDDNRRVAGLLARALASFGFTTPAGGDHCIPFTRAGVRDQNVVAHLARNGRPDAPVVLLGAHYDAQGQRGADVYPGADDNASGVAALLEIARLLSLQKTAPGPDIVIVAFGAEERGVVGSRAYVEAPSVPLARLSLMVNLDMVGRPLLDGSPLRLLMRRADEALGFIVGERDKDRTEDALRRAAAREDRPLFGIPESVLTRLGFSSDSVPFGPHAPTIFLSTGDHADYHQPSDTAEKVDFDQITRAVRLSLAIVDEVRAGGGSVYSPAP